MRGAPTARSASCPKTSALSSTCSVPVMISGPPDPPATAATWPPRVTMVGDMLLSGRLPGAMALASEPIRPKTFGTPGCAEKSSIVSLRMMPVSPATTIEPNVVLMLVVQATALPAASTTDRCDVPSSALERVTRRSSR